MDEVEANLRARSFHDLPGLRCGRKRLDSFHHLTVAPWRGVFLISDEGGDVVDVLFSRVPHVLGDRLGEIAAAYPAPARAALPQKAGSEGRAEEGGAEEGRPAGRKGARSGSSE